MDTKITKVHCDGECTFEVAYQLKDTNTGIYTPNCSYAPARYKTAAMRALFYRAKRISSDHLYDSTCQQIIAIFRANGYQESFILKIKQQIEQKLAPNSNTVDDDTKIIFWKLQYLEQKGETFNKKIKSINSLLNNAKIKPCYQTLKTSSLFKNKDPVPFGLSSNVVYQYKCERCPERYIGETTRHLETRIREHILGRPVPSEITLHRHESSSDNFTIVSKGVKNTRLAETVYIDFCHSKKQILMNERDSSVPLYLHL